MSPYPFHKPLAKPKFRVLIKRLRWLARVNPGFREGNIREIAYLRRKKREKYEQQG